MTNSLEYKSLEPLQQHSSVVDSIWMLKNNTDTNIDGIIIPDGKIDLFLCQSSIKPFQIFLTGIETKPIYKPPYPNSTMFAISFKPLASEYIFGKSFSELINKQKYLSNGFWDFTADDLNDFEGFFKKACKKINKHLTNEIDERKLKLFELIYSSNGSMSVKELSERVFWSRRQINRYFNKQYGLTLKAYCNIIRFHSSLKNLKQGDLFPSQDYADQSHFIKEVKKLSGVVPKILSKNKNDRFIQLTLIPKQ